VNGRCAGNGVGGAERDRSTDKGEGNREEGSPSKQERGDGRARLQACVVRKPLARCAWWKGWSQGEQTTAECAREQPSAHVCMDIHASHAGLARK
jgi:hypothetical protein